jgi:prepilin-type processing-associated H-X9-DG protein
MNENAQHDEILLIDFLTGRLSDAEAQEVHRRLEKDENLRNRHDDLAASFQALDLAPEPEPPADLADRTLAKIAAVQRTNALLAMQHTHSRRSTFSFKELAAVAAMLIVMAGVLIPALHNARQQGNKQLCAMQMGQIGNALQTYGINHEGRLPTVGAPGGRWLRHDDTPPISNSRALFRLLRDQYLHSPVVFQCPGVGGNSFVMESDMFDFPRPEHISYSFQYSLDDHGLSGNDPALVNQLGQMAILADQTPLFDGGVFHPDRMETPHSDNHPDGQNVLYLDGHVTWVEESTVGVEGDHIFLVGDVREYDGDERPANATDSFLLPAHAGR